MRVEGFVGRERNGGELKGTLQALNGRLSQGAVNALLTGAGKGSADADEWIANVLFRNSLCLLVNAWIDSAKTADSERPWVRMYWPEFLQDFIRRNPPLIELTPAGPCLVLVPHVWDKRKKLPAFFEEAVFSHLQDACLRRSVREIFPFAFDAATALYLQLLDSPARMRLSRCDACGVYFMRNRAPKKDTPIYHGSWCENCKGKGAAKRVDESRKGRLREMIGWAADAWESWKKDRRHGVREEWVVRKVNERMPPGRTRIAKNWVTRHGTEIEAVLKRRKCGTQKTR